MINKSDFCQPAMLETPPKKQRIHPKIDPGHGRRPCQRLALAPKEKIMTQNTGQADRIVRIIAGFALLAWAIWGTDPWHAVGWLGAVLVVTAVVGFCPIYRVIGFSTSAAPKRK
jgi:hypothetical protein